MNEMPSTMKQILGAGFASVVAACAPVPSAPTMPEACSMAMLGTLRRVP